MNRINGVLDEKPSVLLYDYDVVCGNGESVELPEEFTIPRDRIPDCRDQQTTGQCVAFSTTNIMQILNEIETGKRERFSTTYVYGRHRDEHERNLVGMYPEKVLSKMCKMGSVKESDLPVLLEVPEAYDYVQSHPELSELDEEAETYKIATYVGFTSADKDKKINDIKTALLTYELPLLGIMDIPDGSHAISLIGWDKTGFTYMNSWGEEVGDKGICHVKYKFLRRAYLMIDATNVKEFPFVDVPSGHWAKHAIEHCYNAGLVNGMDEAHFCPDEPLTRAQLCQILYNTVKKSENGR